MSTNIGVLGCGWLGFPLALSFVKEGYRVHGSTTSVERMENLKENGIRPYLIVLTEGHIEGPILGFLQEVEVLIINVPPRLREIKKENYISKMQLLYNAVVLSTVKKVIFVSSTSVYGNISGDVTEETPPRPHTESGKQILASEHIFMEDSNLQTTVVRFGGLIGPNRHPITHLAGKKNLENGDAPINLIHLNDAIAIIKIIVVNEYWEQVFNGVYPYYPSKKEYYSLEARKRGLPIPEFADNPSGGCKKIIPYMLRNGTNYNFVTSILS